MATAAEVTACMAGFAGGSDKRYRHWFNRRFFYSEGVKAVADLAGAYWLIDWVAGAANELLRLWKDKGESRSYLAVDVGENGTAAILIHDGARGERLAAASLSFTDFPAGEWTFYLYIDGVVDQEYGDALVMFLPDEN